VTPSDTLPDWGLDERHCVLNRLETRCLLVPEPTLLELGPEPLIRRFDPPNETVLTLRPDELTRLLDRVVDVARTNVLRLDDLCDRIRMEADEHMLSLDALPADRKQQLLERMQSLSPDVRRDFHRPTLRDGLLLHQRRPTRLGE
jgi:hypothetical protein